MKNHLPLFALIALLLVVSCKDKEEPAPPHEVGVWALDSYLFINFPSEFEGYEGLAYDIDELSFGNGVVYDDYTLVLEKDGTYSLEIGITGPDINDAGTWEIDNDELKLESTEDNDDQDWTIEKNEEDDLWLSFETQSAFIPDIYFDTVTQKYIDYLNTLTDQQLDSVSNAISRVVSFDLVYVFERD